jgi:hypothetical protein
VLSSCYAIIEQPPPSSRRRLEAGLSLGASLHPVAEPVPPDDRNLPLGTARTVSLTRVRSPRKHGRGRRWRPKNVHRMVFYGPCVKKEFPALVSPSTALPDWLPEPASPRPEVLGAGPGADRAHPGCPAGHRGRTCPEWPDGSAAGRPGHHLGHHGPRRSRLPGGRSGDSPAPGESAAWARRGLHLGGQGSEGPSALRPGPHGRRLRGAPAACCSGVPG